jgi:hypothetical protein
MNEVKGKLEIVLPGNTSWTHYVPQGVKGSDDDDDDVKYDTQALVLIQITLMHLIHVNNYTD